MLNDKQMTTLRKIAVRLRELKPYLDRIGAEVDDERTLLPERLWRSAIDDEACAISVSLDFASGAIDEAVDYIGEVTGEDKPPQPRREPPPFPNKLPSYEEIDAQRRREATAIRERQTTGKEN
jgi:hypothetical protein